MDIPIAAGLLKKSPIFLQDSLFLDRICLFLADTHFSTGFLHFPAGCLVLLEDFFFSEGFSFSYGIPHFLIGFFIFSYEFSLFEGFLVFFQDSIFF